MKVLSGSLRRSSGDDEAWPPGFRFHPTDEELILYYLKRRICGRKIKLDIIGDTDVYKWDPEELPGLSKLKTGDRQWFFFSPRARKYPNGARSNRATRQGYWKATGKDRIVTCGDRDVGIIKTLVFYKGRTPGKRTDWVMHEYTLDEKELSRCIVQNYYVIYKVFKKSGPGPKNGEQYGAPFKEEDWADDGFSDFINSNDQEIPAEKPKMVTTVLEGENCPAFSLDDLETFMKQFTDEATFEFPEADPCATSLPQVGGQEESLSTVVHSHSEDHIFPQSSEVPNTERLPCNAPASFDLPNSALSQLQSFQTPEATTAHDFSEQASVQFEDDFLEMDDLGGPEFIQSITERSSGSLQFEELNYLYELDQFHDATMFLNDLEPFEYGTVSDLYQNENLDNVANPLDVGDFLSNPDCANTGQIDNQMPVHDPAIDIIAMSELQQNSGVLCDPSNFVAETNRNVEVREDGSSASHVSSALWDFIESIPTTPASAAENGLVDRTFSFGRRISIRPEGTTVSAIDSPSLTSRRSSSRKVGFYLFSLLGGFCAILWVFMRSISLWERYISL